MLLVAAFSIVHAKEPKSYVISSKISKELSDFYFEHGFKPRRSTPSSLRAPDKVIFYGCQVDATLAHLQVLYICNQPNEADIQTNAFLIPVPSPIDQLTLAQSVLEQNIKVAVLYSRKSELQYKYLATNKSDNVRLSGYRSYGSFKFDKEILEVIRGSDAVLALVDNTIFNASTLRAIMLSTYREHKPIFGPDKAFVQAGSIASLSVDKTSIAESAIELATKFQNDEYLPGIYFTRTRVYETNPIAAQTLSLDLPQQAVIFKNEAQPEIKDVQL